MEGLDSLLADDATYARVLGDLARLRVFDSTLEHTDVFVYRIEEVGFWFSPQDFDEVADGGNEPFQCLVRALRTQYQRVVRPGLFVGIDFLPKLNPYQVEPLFYSRTNTTDIRWSSSPYDHCRPDICLVVEGSRFHYVFKTGDCNAPTTRTFTTGVDGGIAVGGAWDKARFPSCVRWFDQAKWIP